MTLRELHNNAADLHPDVFEWHAKAIYTMFSSRAQAALDDTAGGLMLLCALMDLDPGREVMHLLVKHIITLELTKGTTHRMMEGLPPITWDTQVGMWSEEQRRPQRSDLN